MEKLIWTPKQINKYSFEIYLDVGFAKELLEAKCIEKTRENMNRLGNDLLKNFRYSLKKPYKFHKDTCFISEIHMEHDDLALTTNETTLESLVRKNKKPDFITYKSKNMQNLSEAYVLMALFNQWVEYSEVLKILE